MIKPDSSQKLNRIENIINMYSPGFGIVADEFKRNSVVIFRRYEGAKAERSGIYG